MEENEITCLWACLKCGKVFYDTEKEFASRGRRCKECANVSNTKQEIHDARCNLEWVEEHLLAVGEDNNQKYIDALQRVDELLERLERNR